MKTSAFLPSKRMESPYLLVYSPQGCQEVLLTVGTCWTIGRAPDSTIVLSENTASRKHAMIQVTDAGEYYFVDLGSRNGSFVQERRLMVPTALTHGDAITIGQTRMEFCYPAQAPQLDTDLTGSTISDARRRLVTLVVMDVRDFTRMTRQVDDRLLAEVMGTWLRRAGEIIKEYGSSVDKYIGDAIMAAWVHSTSDQVPATELQVVLQAIQALSQMSRDLNDEFPLPFIFKVGVGVNTGQAMVGSIGKGDRPEYTVLGDTVNATFRLEKATKEVGVDVVLGVATAEGLGLPFPRYELTLKGYDQPTPFYGASYQELSGFLKELSQKA